MNQKPRKHAASLKDNSSIVHSMWKDAYKFDIVYDVMKQL